MGCLFVDVCLTGIAHCPQEKGKAQKGGDVTKKTKTQEGGENNRDGLFFKKKAAVFQGAAGSAQAGCIMEIPFTEAALWSLGLRPLSCAEHKGRGSFGIKDHAQSHS